MARPHALAVSMITLLLGLAAAGLSFIAYAKRIKVEDVRIDKEGLCVYPGSPSFALGILAAVLILSEQITVSAGSGCFCCGRENKFPANCCGIIGLIFYIISWFSFVIAFVGLIATSITYNSSFLINRKNDIFEVNARPGTNNNTGACLIGKETLFLGCGLWCIITLFFSLVSYAMLVCGRKRHHSKGGRFANEHGVAMG